MGLADAGRRVGLLIRTRWTFYQTGGADFPVGGDSGINAWFVPFRPLCSVSVPNTRFRSPHKRVPPLSIAGS
jgi:hypothetical protein